MPDNNPPDSLPPFGPFAAGCSPTERVFGLAALAAFTHAYCGSGNLAAPALKAAAFGGSLEMTIAFGRFNELPALPRRKVLGSYLALTSSAPRKITNGKRKESAA
jgi:hypothetical protein